MPHKRPPPLDKSLFTGAGPLAPGTVPHAPDPESIHPAFVIDSHAFPSNTLTSSDAILDNLPAHYPRPELRSVVQVKLDSTEIPKSASGVRPYAIHPTILNLTTATPPAFTNIAKGAVDIIVPSTFPMTSTEWDLLEDTVTAIEGTWSTPTTSPKLDKEDLKPYRPDSPKVGRIVIAGLLPPPLSSALDILVRSDQYDMYCQRLSQLSLHPNTYIKALPPVFDVSARTEENEERWADRSEIEKVLRLYLSHAVESFGTHRIIFGSSPALPDHQLQEHTSTNAELVQPIPSGEWYTVLRKALTQLGEGQKSVEAVFGENAGEVYDLWKSRS